MENRRPDIIEMLEKEKEYYLDQIKRVNIALSALKGEMTDSQKQDSSQKKSIPWVKEITKLFNENDKLNTSEVKDKLLEKGYPEALDPNYHNTIYSTLSRMVNKKKTLEKDEDGYFSKKIKKRTPITFLDDDKIKIERGPENGPAFQ